MTTKLQTWQDVLAKEKAKPYFQNILSTLKEERLAGKTIYPTAENCFNAFRYTPLETIKVVILGQDPYHGPGQAHGLSFSVPPGVQPPPSLQNIFKELMTDCHIPKPKHGCLIPWAKQGVFLLNSFLSVEAHKAHSHGHLGWDTFTDHVIAQINKHTEHVVFLLWGSAAKKKSALIDQHRHLVLTSTHPSPLSAHRGFLGCHHFSKANDYLQQHDRSPIDWSLPDEVEEGI